MQKIIKKFGLVLLLTSLSISVTPSLSFATNYVCECKKYNDHLIKIANFRNFLTEFYQSLESDLINSAK